MPSFYNPDTRRFEQVARKTRSIETVVDSPSAPLAWAMEDYLDYIRYEKGLSKQTIYGYSSWLSHFMSWLEAAESGRNRQVTVSFLNQSILTAYLHHHSEKGLRPRTIHGIFYPLRGLGEYLVSKQVLAENPVKKVQMPKKDAAVRQTVSDEEVKGLIESCSKIRNLRRAKLAKAVLSTLAYTGIRRGELVALNLADVSIEDQSILVRCGKGSKSRRVFPSPTCLTAILDWIAVRGEHETDRLFIGGSGRPMGEKSLLTLLDEVKCIAGLRGEQRVCMHSIRHNCATRLLRNGADLGQIQKFLGHSTIQTTQVYLHTSEENIRAIASKTEFSDSPQETPVAPYRADRTRNDESIARRSIRSRRRNSGR